MVTPKSWREHVHVWKLLVWQKAANELESTQRIGNSVHIQECWEIQDTGASWVGQTWGEKKSWRVCQ